MAKNVDAIEVLLDHGVDPNQREPRYGRTPLMTAVTTRNLAAVKLLLNCGADPNVRKGQGTGPNAAAGVGETALIEAALFNVPEMIEALLTAGADTNIASECTGDTALFHAIRQRNAEVVKQLLNAGANSNHLNKRGQRPLDLALSESTGSTRKAINLEIVHLLRSLQALS